MPNAEYRHLGSGDLEADGKSRWGTEMEMI